MAHNNYKNYALCVLFFHCLLIKGMIVNTEKKDTVKSASTYISIAIEGDDDTELNINRLESVYSNESLKLLVRNQRTFAQKKIRLEQNEKFNEYALLKTREEILGKAINEFRSVQPSIFNCTDKRHDSNQNIAVDRIRLDNCDLNKIKREGDLTDLSSGKNDIVKHVKNFLDLKRKLVDCMPIFIKKNNAKNNSLLCAMDRILERYLKYRANGEVQRLKELNINISKCMSDLHGHNNKLVEMIESVITKIKKDSVEYSTYLSIAKICIDESAILNEEVEVFNASVNRVCANFYPIIPSVEDALGTNVPGINKRFYFDFGYKSKQFTLESLYKEKTKIAIVSCKNNLEYMFNIDQPLCEDKIPFVSSLVAEKIDTGLRGLIESLIPVAYKDLLQKRFKEKDWLGVTPSLLRYKQPYSMTVGYLAGIRLTPSEELSNCTHIKAINILFTPHNIDDPVKKDESFGFGLLSIKPARFLPSHSDSSYTIIDGKSEHGKALQSYFSTLKKGVTEKLYVEVLNFLSGNSIHKSLDFLSQMSFAIAIDWNDDNDKNKLTADIEKNGCGYTYIKEDDSLIVYNKENYKAEKIACVFQDPHNAKILKKNKVLLNAILGYTKADIMFIYQLEDYMRAQEKLSVTGDVFLPPNIPAWYIKNSDTFQQWISEKWQNQRWKSDLKDAQTIINTFVEEYKSLFEKSF